MPTGTKIAVTLVRGANATLSRIDSIDFTQFNHVPGYTTTYDVQKNDISNTDLDIFTVVTNWAAGDLSAPNFTGGSLPVTSPPSSPVNVVSDAMSKVNVKFPGTFV